MGHCSKSGMRRSIVATLLLGLWMVFRRKPILVRDGTLLWGVAAGLLFAGEFVFGGEIRADAAFEITRDVSIQMGVNFLEFGRGVGRGRTLQANDEDLTIVGFNGGVIINR